MGVAVDSIVSAGCIVSGGRVLHSVLSPGVRVNSYCEVEYSILMPNVEIGRYSRIRRAIVNTGVKIPESSVHRFRSGSRPRQGLSRHRGRHRRGGVEGARGIGARLSRVWGIGPAPGPVPGPRDFK
jgi:NDP-sugar pyrophosphorylase family protein